MILWFKDKLLNIILWLISGDCGGILPEETGIIQSHDNDNNGRYEDNANCWWAMVAPPNTVIELKFTRMAIQDHAYCNQDYIQVKVNFCFP